MTGALSFSTSHRNKVKVFSNALKFFFSKEHLSKIKSEERENLADIDRAEAGHQGDDRGGLMGKYLVVGFVAINIA